MILIENKVDFEFETGLIVDRVKNELKLKNGFIRDILDKDFTDKELTFYIQLILRSGYNREGYTNKIKILAVVTQIIYLATKIHSTAFDVKEGKQEFKKEVQIPILIGDLLYSKIYDILCKEDCLEFLDDILEYISALNLGWINYFEKMITKKELCSIWYGNLSFMALNHVMQINSKETIFNIKEIGLLFGDLFGAKTLKLPKDLINEYFEDLKNALDLAPNCEKKNFLEQYLNEIYFFYML
ncbi:hypothetical protein [Desulfonispora thiosulfatigenes]|uniref:hypothetical protein n=1 Tax=Desulfonispora thiosulfatigenes TaxID=83661 RepID=UPI000A00856A|nr:hypothetical protein [Desulfonispora thiosulfatigenes]